MLLYIVISCLLLAFTIKFFLKKDIRENNRLPPSPPKLPVIGNLHQFGFLPHRSLTVLSLKHGPLMFVHLGNLPNLIVSSEEMAREIMKTHDLIFSDRPFSIITEELMYHGKDIAFLPYGKYWRKVKMISVVHLLSMKQVESFNEVRKEEVSLMIKTISDASGPVSVNDIAVFTFNSVISRVTLGKKYDSKESSSSVKQLMTDIAELLGTIHIGDIFPSFSWIEDLTGFNARLKKHFHQWDGYLEKVIEEHLDPRREISDGYTPDFVDILLDIQRKEVDLTLDKDGMKGILMDMFTGGTETVSTAFVWMMAEIMRQPTVLTKLQAEIRSVINGRDDITDDDIKQMIYLKAVVKETLRLHPPLALLVPKLSRQDVEIGGYFIPSKTRVIINAWAIGRDPKSWESPDEFWPERFIESTSKSSGVDFRGHDFQLVPFGAGRRICPGINYGITALEFVLANLLYWFDWELPKGLEEVDMSESFGLTTRKKTPLHLIAKSSASKTSDQIT